MNCFMGYNPLATKQVKVTVWVCEQDGATPVAPSNPSAGDCFIVYATDEAVLSNTPTSAKTYTNGEWADAEGGGGGDSDFTTAEVTFINSTVGGEYSVTFMFADDTLGLNLQIVEVNTDAETVQVPIYKGIPTIITGQSFADIQQSMPTVTGNIELVASGFAVSGSGTITCAGQPRD